MSQKWVVTNVKANHACNVHRIDLEVNMSVFFGDVSEFEMTQFITGLEKMLNEHAKTMNILPVALPAPEKA